MMNNSSQIKAFCSPDLRGDPTDDIVFKLVNVQSMPSILCVCIYAMCACCFHLLVP